MIRRTLAGVREYGWALADVGNRVSLPLGEPVPFLPLFSIAIAAHLAGTVVLSLFFVLLARHERRPYLREWTYAWIAQVGALALVLAGPRSGWPLWPGLYLVLTTLHGVFLCVAAQRYAGGGGLRRASYGLLALIAVAAFWVAAVWEQPQPIHASAGALLAATHAVAARRLWRFRDPTAMGLRLVTNLLLILSARHAADALLYASPLAETQGWMDYEAVAPFTTLLVQMFLALGMVLAAMEAGQRQLAGAHAELEAAHRRLKMLADTDPMTGCFNRRVFRDLVDEVRADPARRSGTLLVLDMDGLKVLNDTHGHSAGDQAIRRTADAIRSHTRDGDLVLRWGGDEFVVILPGIEHDEAAHRMEGISAAIVALGLGASVGVCSYGPERDIVIALRDADRQMYEVKAARKARQAAATTAS